MGGFQPLLVAVLMSLITFLVSTTDRAEMPTSKATGHAPFQALGKSWRRRTGSNHHLFPAFQAAGKRPMRKGRANATFSQLLYSPVQGW